MSSEKPHDSVHRRYSKQPLLVIAKWPPIARHARCFSHPVHVFFSAFSLTRPPRVNRNASNMYRNHPKRSSAGKLPQTNGKLRLSGDGERGVNTAQSPAAPRGDTAGEDLVGTSRKRQSGNRQARTDFCGRKALDTPSRRARSGVCVHVNLNT